MDRWPSLRVAMRRRGEALSAELAGRAFRLVRALPARMEPIILAWLLVFGAAATVRIIFAATPIRDFADFFAIFLPYVLAALAPVMGYRVAAAAFPSAILPERTRFRLAMLGRWRRLDPLAARAHPLFGPFGFMASLLVGILINVPVRSFEFLLAVPAMNHHAPDWATTLFYMMTFDLVLMSFLYTVCFVMALRAVPLFPRMLLFTWIMDVAMQLAVARAVAAEPGLPAVVAAPLHSLLDGNLTKVMISATIWLPYLLLSNRVNVTYRGREAIG